MSKHLVVPEVSIEEHKKLIDSLDEDSYIYYFDARYRTAIVHDSIAMVYWVLVCSTKGNWFCIDYLLNGRDITPAIQQCTIAVLHSYDDIKLDSELKLVSYRCQPNER